MKHLALAIVLISCGCRGGLRTAVTATENPVSQKSSSAPLSIGPPPAFPASSASPAHSDASNCTEHLIEIWKRGDWSVEERVHAVKTLLLPGMKRSDVERLLGVPKIHAFLSTAIVGDVKAVEEARDVLRRTYVGSYEINDAVTIRVYFRRLGGSRGEDEVLDLEAVNVKRTRGNLGRGVGAP